MRRARSARSRGRFLRFLGALCRFFFEKTVSQSRRRAEEPGHADGAACALRAVARQCLRPLRRSAGNGAVRGQHVVPMPVRVAFYAKP